MNLVNKHNPLIDNQNFRQHDKHICHVHNYIVKDFDVQQQLLYKKEHICTGIL